VALILLTLFAFGTGKAALMPFHRWLPAAMVAPTPVSALLHAVAVVKAGVFTVLKITVYVFGIDFIAETGAGTIVLWVAVFTLTVASIVALTKDNLKARLAYSTVGQLSYVIVGAMLANAAGIAGAAMQIAMHAMGKITLFFCAGAIYVATHKTEISQLDGLGRKMPFTFAAFFIGAVSIIGLPPMGGAWSKWFLLMGSADAGQWIIMALLLVSSLLNIAYLLPIVGRGFFRPLPGDNASNLSANATPAIEEAPMNCVVPLCITAAGCIALFLFGDAIYHFIQPLLVVPEAVSTEPKS
jgi:multicomponent Na+:H+ antiporter subunit D